MPCGDNIYLQASALPWDISGVSAMKEYLSLNNSSRESLIHCAILHTWVCAQYLPCGDYLNVSALKTSLAFWLWRLSLIQKFIWGVTHSLRHLFCVLALTPKKSWASILYYATSTIYKHPRSRPLVSTLKKTYLSSVWLWRLSLTQHSEWGVTRSMCHTTYILVSMVVRWAVKIIPYPAVPVGNHWFNVPYYIHTRIYLRWTESIVWLWRSSLTQHSACHHGELLIIQFSLLHTYLYLRWTESIVWLWRSSLTQQSAWGITNSLFMPHNYIVNVHAYLDVICSQSRSTICPLDAIGRL